MSEYIVVCNIQMFDIIAHFSNSTSLVWKQPAACKVGDTVYFYLGRPYKQIMYKCRVVETNIAKPMVSYWLNYESRRKSLFMRVELCEKLNHVALSYQNLLDHGLKTVQCSTRVEGPLKKHIDDIIVPHNK